tara:strand:- start:1001 stop:1759 length:759 start_codon:yes stop_codon:yes gene_type:complete
MLKVRIIPCLDVKDGRVVKGINFLNLKDAGDPVEQADFYSKNGADEIVFLDISASIEKRKTLINIVKKTAEKVFIPLTVGGGVSSIQNIRDLLKAGADKVSINTAGILNKQLIKKAAKKFGSQCIVAAVDAKKTNGDWYVYTHGGTKKTNLLAINWIKSLEKLGAGEILLTSMNRDGTKKGFDLDLLKNAAKSVNLPIIASGGVGELKHFKDGVLLGKASGLLAASVFHFGTFRFKEVKNYLKKNGINVRLD